jgi:branched-chain amino acid transport system substrate-binding protein
MNTILKRALALSGAAVLLTSCASNASTDSGSGSGTGSIVIGASLQMSGPIVLSQIRDGYQAAIDDVNAAGGLDVAGTKRKVELKLLDNRGDSNTMVQQVRSLVLSDKSVALLGSCCQQNIDMQGQADALKVPLMMSALPVELLPKGGGYAWDSYISLADGAAAFYKVASAADNNKKILMVTNNDAQGVGTAKQWTAAGEQAGLSVVATKAVPAGTTDFSDVIQAGKSSGAQVLVASMTPPDCFAMWKQMKALAYSPKMAIGLQCAAAPGWASIGALGDGTLLQMNWSKTAGLPKTADILSRFEQKYPNQNDLGSVAMGYHTASVLLEAITKAGSTNSEDLNAALAASATTSAMGEVKFVDNKSTATTYIGQWKGGDVEQVWPAEGASALQPLTGLA